MTHILPSGGGTALMNVDNAALLLPNHQTGLFQTVKDITAAELRANVMALTRIATVRILSVGTTSTGFSLKRSLGRNLGSLKWMSRGQRVAVDVGAIRRDLRDDRYSSSHSKTHRAAMGFPFHSTGAVDWFVLLTSPNTASNRRDVGFVLDPGCGRPGGET
jgi:hypothetical protein